ncbi:hypothetical protein EH165_14710 [Nakamurella antarctica]|uniref:Uncharacterized protein n=1 Tax=Nakamurella antarctica TaxID=1902245 RepID=A0A3G8ZQX2_9ACTN|nr:hypothetical protein [Nakamurella antarctica]AZI59205.1 hypothetical protein EH165_14710 [Nakamurella antarctica]
MKNPRKLKSIDLHSNALPIECEPTRNEKHFLWISHTVVNLYNRQLTKLGGVPAMAPHLRIFIREGQDQLEFGDPITRIDLGIFETAYSGIDATALKCHGYERNMRMLDWLQNILIVLAKLRDWDEMLLNQTYRGCVDEHLEFILESKPKLSPDRRFKTVFKISFDDVDTVIQLKVFTRSGIEIATQESRDRSAIMVPWVMRELLTSANWQKIDARGQPWNFTSGFLGWHFSVEVG